MNSIGSQMHEFQNMLSSIESKYNNYLNTSKEMIADMNYGKKCLREVSANCQKDELDELEKYKEKISTSIFKQCEGLKLSFKNLNDILREANQFQQIELQTRENFNQDPENFDEKEFKKIFNTKITSQTQTQTQIEDHPIYAKLVQFIENSKQQGADDDEEELIMETNQNEIVKCPITGAPIKNPCKNTRCDHVYERGAILMYIKGKVHKNCPFAGCKQPVVIKE